MDGEYNTFGGGWQSLCVAMTIVVDIPFNLCSNSEMVKHPAETAAIFMAIFFTLVVLTWHHKRPRCPSGSAFTQGLCKFRTIDVN